LSLCLDVNQGGTNHNCYIQILVILHAQTYRGTLVTNQKLCQSYSLVNPPEKSGCEKASSSQLSFSTGQNYLAIQTASQMLGTFVDLKMCVSKNLVLHCEPKKH